MSNQIAPLTDEQAIHAVRLFFDYSSSVLWTDGKKPTPERLKQISDTLVSNAPEDIKSAVVTLAADGTTEATAAQAQVARIILARLGDVPAFEPALKKAEEKAREALKFDLLTGGFILALLLATTKIETKGGTKISLSGGMAEILHELPAVMKALPEGVWNAIRGTH
jgi:hypothetical protein